MWKFNHPLIFFKMFLESSPRALMHIVILCFFCGYIIKTLRHLAIWLPLLFWTNISTRSELLTPKIIVIWIMWSSYSFRFNKSKFNSRTEGSISKFLFEIARSESSSTDVDALKFWLVQYDKFYRGEQQEDASECFMMLTELIDKGSVPYCASNDNNSGFLYLKSYFHLY